MGIIKKDAGLLTIIILFTILAIAITLIVLGVKKYLRAHQSNTWPTVQGEIYKSSYKKEWDEDNHSYFVIDVGFRYQVYGKTYFSDNIMFGGNSFDSRAEANNFLVNFTDKKLVTVFYDPDSPDIGVLEPGKQRGGGILIFAGCFLGLLASLFIRIIVLDF